MLTSAPRNIAEGFGRYRPAEFARFVRIARGSLMETKDHFDVALERRYVSSSDFGRMNQLVNRAFGASTRLVQYLDEAAKTWIQRSRRP
jgi:four helix bundle protein